MSAPQDDSDRETVGMRDGAQNHKDKVVLTRSISSVGEASFFRVSSSLRAVSGGSLA